MDWGRVNQFRPPNRDKLSGRYTHERHYDWTRIELTYPSPSREGCSGPRTGSKKRVLRFVDERDKSAPVKVTLAPGKSLTAELDLNDWAGRRVNGAKPIAPGWYKVRVVYEVDASEWSDPDVWHGRTRSKPFPLTVSGEPRGDMCPRNPGWKFFQREPARRGGNPALHRPNAGGSHRPLAASLCSAGPSA